MSSFHQLADIPVHEMEFGTLQLLRNDNTQVLWGKMKAGGHVPNHSHPNEQITWLVKGKFDYVLGTGEEKSCEAGTILVIPGGVEHEVWYREECEIVEFFSPPRTDIWPALETNPYGVE